MASPWEFFTLSELKCRCGTCNSTGEEMNKEFMLKIMALRRLLGVPFIVTSAYRCSYWNKTVSNSSNGAHTLGKAMDIAIQGHDAFYLTKNAMNMGFTGIGVKQKGTGRYIHLDTCTPEEIESRPCLWSY